MSEEYEIHIGSDRMQLDLIHTFLSTAYWSEGIPLEVLRKAVKHSLCAGVFQSGKQVGFARAITDSATFAYISDVYILEEHRGIGLSKRLLDGLFAHPDLKGLRRMLLATKDAHALYTVYGFTTLTDPNLIMENRNPNVYSDE